MLLTTAPQRELLIETLSRDTHGALVDDGEVAVLRMLLNNVRVSAILVIKPGVS